MEDCFGLLFGNAKSSEPKLVGDCGRHTQIIRLLSGSKSAALDYKEVHSKWSIQSHETRRNEVCAGTRKA